MMHHPLNLPLGTGYRLSAFRGVASIYPMAARLPDLTGAIDVRRRVEVTRVAVQALLFRCLENQGCTPPFVGSEPEELLQTDGEFTAAVVRLLARSHPGIDATEARRLVALGSGPGGRTGKFWVLNTLDDTESFLRGGPYAVSLARIEAGRVTEAYLACPNLPFPALAPFTRIGRFGSEGCLFHAAVGCGARMWPAAPWGNDPNGPQPQVLKVAMAPPHHSRTRICGPARSGNPACPGTVEIARSLGILDPPRLVDGLTPYAVLACGDTHAYLRLATDDSPRETILEHAAGALLVAEAGAMVTDQEGWSLDFGEGRHLESTRGIVAAVPRAHTTILEALRSR